MAFTLGELARRFSLELRGDAGIRVSRVESLEAARGDALTFFVNARFRDGLSRTRAAAVVLAADHAEQCPAACLISENPYSDFARIAALLHPAPAYRPGVDASATVEEGAVVAADASVAAGALVETGARVGAGARIGPGCVIGRDSIVGEHSCLHYRVVIYPGCRLGRRCIVHAGAVIGADGFGLARDGENWLHVPQLGGVTIGDDVEIGANTTIDRGALDDTQIGNGVKLDNQIQIAHNVVVGDHTVMAAFVGIAGSARIGRRCMLGGRANISGHVTIADDVQVAATSFVNRSLHESGMYSSAITAQKNSTWRRNAARLHHLDEFFRRVARFGKSET